MAKNDLILIDSIIEERVSENLPSNRKDEVFEFLSYEQVLKEYDLSADDIKSVSYTHLATKIYEIMKWRFYL